MRLNKAAYWLALLLARQSSAQSSTETRVQSVWTAPTDFPTSLFESYYQNASQTQQPQPILQDVLSNSTFPASLTNSTFASNPIADTVNFPESWRHPEDLDPIKVYNDSVSAATSAISSTSEITGNCTRCIDAISAGQQVARYATANFSDALVSLCKNLRFKSDDECGREYAASNATVAMWAQVLQVADVKGEDGQRICNAMFGTPFCDRPKTSSQELHFKPKPADAKAPYASGKRVKVVHLSDIHLDPRYTYGSEAVNCASSGCCRAASGEQTNVTNPAPLNGHKNCGTPYTLLASALSSINPLLRQDAVAWTIFTGDLMPREDPKFLWNGYLAYVQAAVFKALKYFLSSGPVYPVLGALDAFYEEQSISHPLVSFMRASQSNNYDRMKNILETNDWVCKNDSGSVSSRNMMYATTHPAYPKLKIITLNTNFWSPQNFYNYVNTTNPQDSLPLSYLITVLQEAEDAQQVVWLVGHAPPFSLQSLPNHSEAFYQIIERYTPHVIAGVFFGHLHVDSISVFYKNGAKDGALEQNALMTAWLAPTLSPKNGWPAYKVYEVDTGDFHVYESYTFFTNQTSSATANAASTSGLVWELGSDARALYGNALNWPSSSPLNATFWHRVGDQMLKEVNSTDPTDKKLVTKYRKYKSGATDNCDASCVNATVCRMRAAKESLWEQCGNDGTEGGQKSTLTPAAGGNAKRSLTSEQSGFDIELDIVVDNAALPTSEPGTLQKRWGSVVNYVIAARSAVAARSVSAEAFAVASSPPATPAPAPGGNQNPTISTPSVPNPAAVISPSNSGSPVPGGPAPVPGGPAPVPGGPAPVPGGPAPVPGGPAPVPAGPAPVPAGPAPIPVDPIGGAPSRADDAPFPDDEYPSLDDEWPFLDDGSHLQDTGAVLPGGVPFQPYTPHSIPDVLDNDLHPLYPIQVSFSTQLPLTLGSVLALAQPVRGVAFPTLQGKHSSIVQGPARGGTFIATATVTLTSTQAQTETKTVLPIGPPIPVPNQKRSADPEDPTITTAPKFEDVQYLKALIDSEIDDDELFDALMYHFDESDDNEPSDLNQETGKSQVKRDAEPVPTESEGHASRLARYSAIRSAVSAGNADLRAARLLRSSVTKRDVAPAPNEDEIAARQSYDSSVKSAYDAGLFVPRFKGVQRSTITKRSAESDSPVQDDFEDFELFGHDTEEETISTEAPGILTARSPREDRKFNDAVPTPSIAGGARSRVRPSSSAKTTSSTKTTSKKKYNGPSGDLINLKKRTADPEADAVLLDARSPATTTLVERSACSTVDGVEQCAYASQIVPRDKVRPTPKCKSFKCIIDSLQA